MSKVEIVTRRAFICASLLVIAGTFNNPALGCNPGYSSNQDSQSQGSQYGYTGFQSYSNCPPSWQTSQVPQGGCPGYSGWQGSSGGSYLNVSTHEAPNLQTRVGYTYTVQTPIYTGWLD